MNLSNLKPGQTKTIADADVEVTKTDIGYEVSLLGVASGILAYDKDQKVWRITAGGQSTVLDGATAKTVVDMVVELWTADAGTDEPVEDEPAETDDDDEAIEAVEDDVDTLDYDVDVTGGHGAHRVTALATIAVALGGAVDVTVGKGTGYRRPTTLHVQAPADVIKQAAQVLKSFEAMFEPQARVVSRAASSAARKAGKHHSAAGFYAHAGYIRGAAARLAKDLAGQEVELPKTLATGQQFDQAAYRQGWDAVMLAEVK
jgi:hypothetical protein